MAEIQMTAAHWAFLLVVASIMVSIAFRKGVIIPSILGTFLLGLLSPNGGDGLLNTLIFAAQAVFRALLDASVALFDIVLVIALMVAMLRALQAQGADKIMVAPMKKLMIGPWSSFFALTVTMYIAAVFFWPTPAIALVGPILIPIAIRAGLPAIAAAVAVNLAGHGMALSADPVIQGAGRLTASAAGISPGELQPYALLFSVVAGTAAILFACYTLRRDLRSGALRATPGDIPEASAASTDAPKVERTGRDAHIFAILVPVLLLGIALLMIYRAIFQPGQAILGGAATALLGGTATCLLLLSTIAKRGLEAMDEIAAHTCDGLLFSIRIFAPIIPIAGFFFLGNPEHAAAVLGEGTPGYLFDVSQVLGQHLNGNVGLLAFGMTLIGVLAGLDGSGFSGLPLTGSLAGALAVGGGTDIPVLAALAQVATVFTGGGTLVAWAGSCVCAGIAGVSPEELVRRNFIPVMFGLCVAALLAMVMLL